MKAPYEYLRDVKRLLERNARPSQYEAALAAQYDGALRYPSFPLFTRLGELELRILGRTSATLKGVVSIYSVTYDLDVHLEQHEGVWRRYSGVVGFSRQDRTWGTNLGPARARFDRVVLPTAAAALDDPQMVAVRDAAHAVRLGWELGIYRGHVREFDAMILELTEARDAEAARIAAGHAEIARIATALRTEEAA